MASITSTRLYSRINYRIRHANQLLCCHHRVATQWPSVAYSTEQNSKATQLTSKDTAVERFIPMTRRSLIRRLMQEKALLSKDELQHFDKFATALDSAVVHRYHNLLQELKTLFDPINPDKDTVVTRQLNRRERLDHEFWVLQKLNAVMSKANFYAISDEQVKKAFAEHDTDEGVRVAVDRDAYDVCQFWALGKETPPFTISSWRRFYLRLTGKQVPVPPTYYKRVVVAMRLKRDEKLCLKAFKEIPVDSLEQLMPDGKISMNRLDRRILVSTGAIAGISVLAKVITLLAHLHVDWTLIVTAVSSAVAVQAWGSYKARHLAYLNDFARVLYFKNIANNRSVLTTMVDRAEDELFKEALLVYTFLVTNRVPAITADNGSEEQQDDEDATSEAEFTTLPDGSQFTYSTKNQGAMSVYHLESKVQDWVKEHTGCKLQFSSTDACTLLSELGLLTSDLEGNMSVLSLPAALRNLPLQPQSLIARSHEHDLVEGYDRHVSDETELEYKQDEDKRRKYGWF